MLLADLDLIESLSTESAFVNTILGCNGLGAIFGTEFDWSEYGCDLLRAMAGREGERIVLNGVSGRGR